MKSRTKSGDLGSAAFISEFQGRDALPRNLSPESLTATMVEEVGWELGYEGFPVDRLESYRSLAKSLGANLFGEYDAGRRSR